MPDPLIGQLLLQVVLIALNAVFACAEIAVLSASEPRLEQLSKSGDKRARRLLRLTEQPSRFLSVIQVAITLSGFLGSAYAADNFSEYIVHWLVGLGVPVPVNVLDAASVFLVTLILSYITLIFGELVPKRLAMQQPEKISLAISGLVSAVSKVFAPLVWLLTRSTNGVLRLMRVDPDQDNDAVSEEEIRLMVDKGSETGAIDITERDFIENVFAFDDLTVEEFATHRTEVTFLWLEDSQEDWENTLRTTRHSRYPVCDQTSDQVVGVLSVRDYFFLTDRSRENVMQHAVQPPCFVPETIRADVLFRQMQRSRNHFAVVLDEYGGVTGIVTMNDVLEQLVGDLDNDAEAPVEAEPIEELEPGLWLIRGSASLEDVAEVLDLPLPDEECDTFGGFVFAAYGSVPEDGTVFHLQAGGMNIEVLEISGHKLELAKVRRLSEKEDQALSTGEK